MTETRDSSFSRDLLQRFTCTHFPVKSEEENVRLENVELSLGLSLNGRFGIQPEKVVDNDNNKLFRASSVVDFVNFPANVELSLDFPVTRTCSLPPDTEAVWRKRKELQSFRRSEAKRKRTEKLKNVTGIMRNPASGLKQSPATATRSPEVQFSSQGSIVSQGSGGSSGVSDFQSHFQGINKDTEVKSTTPERSLLNQLPSNITSGFNRSTKVNPPIEPTKKNSFKKSSPTHETSITMPTEMPYVSTKEDGPDGKRVQGFLYRYGNGEEVRIMCVCHGTFLTPSEFVRHGGGGGDVENPLRHIIVTSSSFC